MTMMIQTQVMGFPSLGNFCLYCAPSRSYKREGGVHEPVRRLTSGSPHANRRRGYGSLMRRQIYAGDTSRSRLRPKTAKARITSPIPVRMRATPTTIPKTEICSAM